MSQDNSKHHLCAAVPQIMTSLDLFLAIVEFYAMSKQTGVSSMLRIKSFGNWCCVRRALMSARKVDIFSSNCAGNFC